MVRSLGLVVVIIVPVWFFAQPPDSDQVPLRVVDPAADIAAFSADAPAVPVPGPPPSQWKPNVSRYLGGERALRVGYNTPSGHYAEYYGTGLPSEDFLRTAVGAQAEQREPLTVDGKVWERYEDADGSISLTRSFGAGWVVVGTLRASATVEELELLVRSLSG